TYGEYDGVGFVLGRDEETDTVYSGVDFDDVRNPGNGELTPWCAYCLAHLNTYAEVSPSGTGVKAFTIGELPKGQHVDHKRGVEMYERQYFTVTGHRLDRCPTEVEERTEALRAMHAMIFEEHCEGDESTSIAPGTSLSERELALSALAGLSKQRADGYWDWLAVGMALHAVDCSQAMLDEWERWSQSCPQKYQPGGCARKWNSFKRGGITL